MKQTNSPEDAKIIVQKLPSDMGIHRNPRKGALNAPDVLMDDCEFKETVLIEEVFPDEFDLEETQERIKKSTEDISEYGKPLLSIGGDHSVSFPVIKALKQENPGITLVWLDAHLDLKEKVNDHVSHDVVVRELLDYFDEDEIFFVGVTEVDDDEESFLQDHNMKIWKASETESFLEEFSEGSPVYLSVDIDVLKEDTAPGTGYPDGELELPAVEKIINEVNPAHADLVEVAPPFDRNNKTISAGRKILKKLVETL